MRRHRTRWIVLLASAAWAAQGLPKLKPGFNLFTGLAGVIAHEISHVALRHGTNQAAEALSAQILAGAGYNPERMKGQVGQLPEPPKPPLSNKK
jgi:hypothetical protein